MKLQLYVVKVDNHIIYKVSTYEKLKEAYPNAEWIDTVDKEGDNIEDNIPLTTTVYV